MVNRQLPDGTGTRTQRKMLLHVMKGRGRFNPSLGTWITWGKHNSTKTVKQMAWRRAEYIRQFEATGRL